MQDSKELFSTYLEARLERAERRLAIARSDAEHEDSLQTVRALKRLLAAHDRRAA